MQDPIRAKIPGFERYEVDQEGNIWSFTHKGNGKQMSPSKHGRYRNVNLFNEHGRFTRGVHRIVLEAFVGPRPAGMCACHSPDPNTSNNRLTNLRWDTPKENTKDISMHGRRSNIGESNRLAKLTADKASTIRELYSTRTRSVALMARDFGVSESAIRFVIYGKTWKPSPIISPPTVPA